MSLASRIYRILRANLPEQRSPEDDEGFTSKPDFGGKGQRTHDGNTSETQDPELARYYANLEVSYGSDLKTVRESWKRLLRKYHPDLHSSDPRKRQVANKLTQGLNRAYQVLAKHLENDHAK
ncbi:J domain-containing protein [bacterium]|nr:J domain-containing protein [bacterium]